MNVKLERHYAHLVLQDQSFQYGAPFILVIIVYKSNSLRRYVSFMHF